jgi:dTDP-glucose 4,6-dehydratase
MRLLVTGGCGFIGSNFVRQFLSKYPDAHITNLDKLTYAGNPANLADLKGNARYRFVKGDICDAKTAAECMKDADAIVHFAAESHVDNSITDPNVFMHTNVHGTVTLLNAARAANIKRFVHVSTDEVYGSRNTGEFSENDPLAPSSPYSAAKAASDLFAKAYHATYGMPVVITRSSNNFGPYQYPEKLIPLFITNLIEGKKVPVYGTGKNVRDWLYVLDNCDAIDTVLQKGKIGEVYNIAGGHELTNLEITKKLLAALGKDDSAIEYVKDRPGHDWRYAITSEKIRALGWSPRHNFEQALAATIAWYAANESWWKPLKGRKQ